jgi:hypothetical protein
MQEFFTNLLAAIGTVVLGAGAISGVVWWLFRTFSERWLNAKFEERLAAYKHEQQKELEHLKFEINAQMDRATKLHQREFETLPEAWSKLTKAFGVTRELVSRAQSLVDLNSMSDAQREDLLGHSQLAEWQKQKVRDATDKTTEYRQQAEPFRIARAKKASTKFYLYFRANGIFIREPLKQKFDELDQLILAALSERQINFQNKLREFVSIDKLNSTGEKLIKELEADVQKRLWDSATQNHQKVM